ncbi:MAG: M56 family metallopeptidase [Bacteroidetes bacterium]|nr:M56 family metallopeptidase [Bacteroidota bacterium]
MNDIVQYMIRSTFCLVGLYLVYWLFLRKDTFFAINRIYLLLAIIFSMTVPLFSFHFSPTGTMVPVMIFLEPVLITPEKIESLTSNHLSWMEATGLIYLTGVIIFTLRFLIQLIQLWLVVRRNGIIHGEGMKLVFVDKGYSPFSFFNMIYIKRKLYEEEQLKTILQHEQVHIRQFHSFDLILAEILTIVQWFNPIVWILQQSLKNLHEYLADEGVMKEGVQKIDYQQLIFNQTLGKQINNLTNNFNVSLIKQRMIMMTKSRSKTVAKMKILFVLPALLLTLVVFSSATSIYLTTNDKSEQTTQVFPDNKLLTKAREGQIAGNDSVYKVVEKSPEYPGGKKALMVFLSENIKYPKEAIKKGITGTVYVSFIVEKDGSVSNVKILRGIGSGCDKEALRVVYLLKSWKPGMDKGKPVRVSFALPIKYALQDKDKKADDKKK